MTPSPTPGVSAKLVVMLLCAVVLFLLTRFYIFFELRPLGSEIFHYFDYAASAIDLHQTPYQNNLKIEYPPLAWWIIRAPRLLDKHQITDPRNPWQVKRAFTHYKRSFRSLLFLCDLVCFAFFLKILWKRRPRLAGWAALSYAVTTAILGPLLYDRLDMGLLLLLMFWAFCWKRSLDETGRTIVWTTAAYAMLGFSISFKLIPLICVPFLVLSEWHAPQRWTRLSAGLLALIVGAGLPFAVQYAYSGPGVFALFEHHAEREIQIDSMFSTLMMIASLFGSSIFVSHSHGAFNLSGDLAHAMKILSSLLLFGFLAGMGLWAFLRRSRYRRQDAYCMACYVIAAAVILSNVLSPQYFIWAFPLALLLAVEVLPERYAMPWILLALLVAVAVMTTWIFPYHYFRTESTCGLVSRNPQEASTFSPVVCVILGLRNLLYLGVVAWLGVMLFRRPEGIATAPAPTDKEQPPPPSQRSAASPSTRRSPRLR